ncbi:MAG: hypothetical protein J0M12_01660 [Deltaproteobacteria bacterium]|nr:hypothetical protein [Deltaproteobacteria bacterium]
MKMLRLVALLGLTSLILTVNASAQAPAATEKAKPAGKVYIVNLEQGPNLFSYVLRDLKTCSIESLVFLCGIQLDDSWLAGKRVLIPNASVKSLYEFESFDDYRNSVKSMQAAAAKIESK